MHPHSHARWRSRSLGAALLATGVLGLTAGQAGAATPAAPPSPELRVIVREGAGSGSTPEHVVATLGGEVLDQLPAMSSFVAVLPADGVVTLAATPGVESVTPDGQVTLLSGSRDDRWIEDRGQPGSLSAVTSGLSLLQRFVSGKGVGVALIDSGIAPVEGLNSPDQVVNGVDLSFESQAPGLLHLDTFGHGTHMAGIINGRNPEIATNAAGETGMFTGVAPGSTVVNVKVAGADGAVDVSQVIAAIDWVVEHKNDNGMNVRVLNLSFGTQSTQSYLIDPLAHAAEVAWRNGIVVVVAAGNEGNETSMLNDPATDPYVLAVGASDQGNVLDPRDDKVAPFSSRGSLTRMPDILAPGKGIVSLRVPGSLLDQSYPSARMHDVTGDERFFRGSGTSQSAAVVSGVVALLLQYRPNLTPDQVKCLLTQTADRLPGVDPRLQGAGSLNVARAFLAGTPKNCVQTHPTSTGTGSLELARGGSHVADPDTGEELVGEIDIFGTPWDGRSWSAASMAGVSWSGGNFLGVSWSGVSWSGVSWSGRSWSGVSWSGRSWSGVSWSGRSWSGVSWSGVSWSGVSWSGRSWSGVSWSGRSWSGRSWR